MRIQRVAQLQERVIPLQKELANVAVRMRDAGLADASRLLQLLRLLHDTRLDVLSAERQLYRAWVALERACGAPLLRFPGEAGEEEQEQEKATPEDEKKR